MMSEEVRLIPLFKLLMAQSGISENKLAKELNLSQPIINNVVNLRIKPWPKLRKMVANKLNVAESDIFNESGWPKVLQVKELRTYVELKEKVD